MKALKIILAIAVIAAIGFFVGKSLGIIGEVGKIESPKNQFVERIEQEIDSLSKMPDNVFCKDFYKEVSYHLNNDYTNGRLGKDSLDKSGNEQWNTNLTSNLYTTYAEKFINQAYYVFKRSEWDLTSLNFIRSENQMLQKSTLLDKSGSVAKSFAEIQHILSKYDEVVGFISSCRNFSFSFNFSMASQFPISDVKTKISQAKEYLNNRLGNEYVNNCTRLHTGLKEVPQALFYKHVNYLNNKIQNWSGKYSDPIYDFKSQADYVKNLYQPLKSEIDLLNIDTYDVSFNIFQSNYSQLKTKLDADSQKAYTYFSN